MPPKPDDGKSAGDRGGETGGQDDQQAGGSDIAKPMLEGPRRPEINEEQGQRQADDGQFQGEQAGIHR